ncbi:fermentation-respiration switch protein FrsA (DUF1100 family) [Arcticibacter tournemirensis]|uniref:SnoaL-like domain-containing protein n=2 Tax=Arcticibacter tournemirensis TaxID=699437 RepID=A0A4Q0MAZ4_9SPHI|nr:nuclear transport factor 2 family protein [Arcticibacter tournemirensis]KAA8479717.1 hypothetical protein F1649_16425 [Arcticibacter tournemirensis]RXF70183.1 hypothetical protein EKH83_09920 [Arcticibacter tournemirensis]TQM50254.1 fermentation-respiration switch protein FrsA (DUF1100 family) [Arcticibacter tournemirensis]
MMQKTIHFYSEGLRLAGNLYLPEDIVPGKKYPAIIVGGSWTTVKEQMSGAYAKRLSKHGFITLAFDPRYFGESEGQPRYWENPEAKITDYANAISYLQTLNEVNPEGIFLTSVCASAGYMAVLAAKDDRIKGIAMVAAWLHDANAVRLIYGGEQGVQNKINAAQKAYQIFSETGEVTYIPVISTTDTSAAMFGEYDYYLNAKRGAVPQWNADKFAVMSWEGWLTFNPMPLATAVMQPVLMVHADDAVLSENAKQFFAAIPHTQKVLHWTEGTQFDFYDNPLQLTEAVAAVSVFFKSVLVSSGFQENSNGIIRQINKLFTGVDDRNWQEVMSVMYETVLLDYSSMNGNPANMLTPKEITDAWAAFLPGFDKTYHQLSQFELQPLGTHLTAHFKGLAEHWLGDECWTVEGSYDMVFNFINGVWLLTEMKFNFEKQNGNTELPGLITTRINK